jgi:hypothetical protein
VYAVITTDNNSPIENVYVANDHEEAVRIARVCILQTYAENINYWRTKKDEEARNMYRLNVYGFLRAITMSWGEIQNIMSNGDLDRIHIIEVGQPPAKPDMRSMCIEFLFKQCLCGGCLHEKKCNEPRMPDVGMMQD